ncbi:MAG: hypothetical protein LRS47_04085 [Desulfurococcales archaeon]|nr:hypothetical protein [Desulfurococcales archaeon]
MVSDINDFDSIISGEEEEKEFDAKNRWVKRMMESAKRKHRLCPYYDKKTQSCFLMLTLKGVDGKCDRDGRFDNCPIFIEYLEKAYQHYTEKKKTLPSDFQDLVNPWLVI